MTSDDWLRQVASLQVDAEEMGQRYVHAVHANWRLEAENAALREALKSLAYMPERFGSDECPFCDAFLADEKHHEGCAVTKARELVTADRQD